MARIEKKLTRVLLDDFAEERRWTIKAEEIVDGALIRWKMSCGPYVCYESHKNYKGLCWKISDAHPGILVVDNV